MDFVNWQAGAGVKRWFPIYGGASKRGDATPLVQHPERHPNAAVGSAILRPALGKPPVTTWSEDFIFSGGSAFLLLIAVLFPNYWYFSFFALAPFFYRLISAKGGSASGGKAAPSECLRLGFLFGLSFFSLAMLDSLITSPLPSVLKLFSGTALFALFGWTAGWARERWGFNPFILVFLWVGLEMGLVRLGFIGGLLGKGEFSQPFLHGLVVLFGFLTVSVAIVLFNSLLVIAIVKTLLLARANGNTVQEDEKTLDPFSTFALFAQRVYLVPDGRAPPLPSV
jgi:hypothetical protein